jgi:L-ascorbate 6-phosphate lactonase
MTLSMKQLRDHTVPARSLTVWALGQAGFLIKSPGDTLIVIDPYLSDRCAATGLKAGLDMRRLFPPPIEPAELAGIDLYVLTHTHDDHLDRETLDAYRSAGGAGPYLAPHDAAERLTAMGVPAEQVRLTWPSKVFVIGDVTLRTTFAIGFGGDDLTHVGYLISLRDCGPNFYFTGDTAYDDAIATSVAAHKPDVMLTVINGMWRNLGPADAARLASRVQPRVVIPCHHDLFPDGLMPPHTLRVNLMLYEMQDRFHTLSPGEPWTFTLPG